MTREGRFAWRLHIDGADDDGRSLELTGSARDVAELHRALLGAATDAHAHFEHHGRVVGDEEDGWELRQTSPPPAKAAKAAKAAKKG